MTVSQSPRISCIVPVYNGEKYLEQAIDSIRAQTLRAFEIVVVDDGSTDATPELARRYTGVRYARQANAGPSAARNLGIRESRGDLLAFLDADDLWQPRKLELQAMRFAARPDLDVSLTHARNFWEPEVGHERASTQEASIGVLPAQTLMTRRSTFEHYGMFDASMLHREVPGWLARLKHRGAVIETLTEVLCDRRIHATNRSRGSVARDAPGMLALAQALIEQRRAQSKTGT